MLTSYNGKDKEDEKTTLIPMNIQFFAENAVPICNGFNSI